MRWIIAGLLIALAAPAAAQPPYYDIDNLRAQQEAAARSAVARTNELSTLETRLRTEQALSDLRLQSVAPRLPYLPYEAPASSGPPAATPKYPSVPDAMLADSNRRVREASRPAR
jgi:hypothetical protein